jgi:hypothetical protein
MAKFLNTSKTNSELEDMIINAQKELILITPYIQLSDRMRELLADKNRLRTTNMRIIHGKNELAPEEMNWLKNQDNIRISFYKNLHAKCYLSENCCIITSLNLYAFSQVNNYEMGVLINKVEDAKLYEDTYNEVIRLIRNSSDVNNSSGVAAAKPDQKIKTNVDSTNVNGSFGKLTIPKLAKKLELKTEELTEKLINFGYLEVRDNNHHMTEKGKAAGGETRPSQFGSGFYFLWSPDFDPDDIKKLRTAELATTLGVTRDVLFEHLKELGYVKFEDKSIFVTEKGVLAGVTFDSDQSGSYVLWSKNIFMALLTHSISIGFQDGGIEAAEAVGEKFKRAMEMWRKATAA